MLQLKVLIVDDEIKISKIMYRYLKMLSYDSDIAVSAEEALELVAKNRYDAALLDFQMPGMNGVQLYEQIKKIQPNLMAIMMTGNAGADGVERSIEAGILAVLQKPVEREDLLVNIQRAIRQTLENDRKSAEENLPRD